MGRYMAELGMTPASRSRAAAYDRSSGASAYDAGVLRIERVIISLDEGGNLVETTLGPPAPPRDGPVQRIELDERL